jgi:hypothetical protein
VTAPAPEPAPSLPVAPEPAAQADPDEELASALRLALSQTRRTQLPPPTRYESESWSSETHSGSDGDPQTAPDPAHRWTLDHVLGTESPAGDSPTATPANVVAATGAPTRESAPDTVMVVDSGGPALPARTAAAPAEQPARVDTRTQVRRPAACTAQEPAAAPHAGRVASGVKKKRAKSLRPALLGPQIGARLVDTAVTYALVGVLAVVLAKIDAAQTSGVPQTVWLVDGTVLANAGLLLAALLAVGIVYETIPLAIRGAPSARRSSG